VDVPGIDVVKRDLHAPLLQKDRAASKSVPNSETGITQLQTWLENRNADRVHACLEATGGWSEHVAIPLGEAGHMVSIVNPSRIKAFAQSEMVRTKTDRIDAALIARFCRFTSDLADVLLAALHGAMLRMKVDRTPDSINRFKRVFVGTLRSSPPATAHQRASRLIVSGSYRPSRHAGKTTQ